MILEVKNLTKTFSVKRGLLKKGEGAVTALGGISFCVDEFSSLAIAGESGSGKTTLAKIILGLIPPTKGEVVFNTAAITNFRKDVQIIFQNPYNSLNPKMRIIDVLKEPLLIHKIVPGSLLRGKVIENIPDKLHIKLMQIKEHIRNFLLKDFDFVPTKGVEKKIISNFTKDVKRLEKLIGRSLSHWKSYG